MNRQSKIEVALAAADQPLIIESAAQLEKAAEAWLQCEIIAIDTEFVRERTWRADLGLVQLSDGQRVWLVDPLKTGPLHPLAAVLKKQETLKVLHAPSEDLGVLIDATDHVPEPLFDTQIACAVAGQSLQMGYHKTVEWLVNISISKDETRSNWCKRPLRPAQLHYAALDVCLLPLMYKELVTRLNDLGRMQWVAEDSKNLLCKARTPADPKQAWQRINGNNRLDGASLAILQKLAYWRDQQAEHRNLARGFVVPDVALMKISQQQPTNLDVLSRLDVLHPRTLQRFGKTMVSAVEQVLQSGLQAVPPATLDSEQRPLLKNMRKLVQAKAKVLAVDPALLASRRELENLLLLPAAEPLPDRLSGWRKKVITHDLIALKAGHRAL